jgi:integrase
MYDDAMASADHLPTPAVLTVAHKDLAFYEAKFHYAGKAVKRRIGRAWLELDPSAPADRPASERFMRRRGRVAEGFFDARTAQVRAAEIVNEYAADAADADRIAQERRTRGVTFRQVALAYLDWLERVKGAKPATLRQHRSDLADPDVPYKRGTGTTAGHIMRVLGEMPAARITTADVEQVLDSVEVTGVSPRTINRFREVMCAAFNFGMKSSTFRLPANPAKGADRRRLPARDALVFYTPEEIEALARTLESGLHRLDVSTRTVSELQEDRRDAEAVRVAAYAGLRLGELLALRWRDIDWSGSALTISRALSAGVEGTTKSGQVRRVPMADQAAAAMNRLSQRDDFVQSDELVFCNPLGRRLDGSALRRRFKRARDAAGLRPLRWHDLRHTFGSLLVAGGVDLVSVKDAMGHSQLSTTSRYLHAKPATERAAAFTAAFSSSRQPTQPCATDTSIARDDHR